MELVCEASQSLTEDTDPACGLYLRDVYIQGAQWNTETGTLTETR